MRSILVCILASLLTVTAGGCATTHAEQGQIIGGVLGGVAGAQVGDGSGRTAAIILGTLAGGMIGRHIGATMDDTDRMRTAQALDSNRTGESTRWVNPDNGNSYEVTPTMTYEGSGGPCREFTLDAQIGSQPDEEVHGTACLRADGSWEIS